MTRVRSISIQQRSERSPDFYTQRARNAALARHRRNPGADPMVKAREAALDQFAKLADPDNVLDAAEREQQAKILRDEHLRRIARRSVEVRRAKRDARLALTGPVKRTRAKAK